MLAGCVAHTTGEAEKLLSSPLHDLLSVVIHGLVLEYGKCDELCSVESMGVRIGLAAAPRV